MPATRQLHDERVSKGSAHEPRYLEIVRHYESCLARHGDTPRGLDWPNADDLRVRYRVMLDLLDWRAHGPRPATLLDFGCGTSGLYEYMRDEGIEDVEYTGLEISKRFLQVSREKFPENSYLLGDVLAGEIDLPDFDYVVMNGVFTVKRGLSFREMSSYFRNVLRRVFPAVGTGLAVNVMSKHVDWEREDLFHLPFDTLARFLAKEISHNFLIRNDYGLYEYTTYIFPERRTRHP